MSSISDLFFTAELDDSRLPAQATKAGRKAGDAMGKAASQTLGQQIGKGFVQGLGLAGALGAANIAASASAAVVNLIGDSIEAASALQETVSKGRVIFGQSADEIEAWAETASTSFGQSKRAAIDAASGYAGLFATVGIAADEAADKGQKLTELGSDLASFFNTDVQQALDALKSGLSGESEPLRKFNVFLSETAVSAELARLGIKKVGGQFTEGQKATARYNLILAQTGSAQGDFARTSEGLANTQRTLNAEIENLKAEIGEELLPVARDLAAWARDDGVPALSALVQVVKDATGVLGELSSTLDHFSGAANHAGEETDLLGSKTTPLGKALHGLADGITMSALNLQDLADGGHRVQDFMAELDANARHAAMGMTGMGEHAGKAADDTAAALGTVGAAAGAMGGQVAAGATTAVDALRNLRKEAITAARGIVDRAYTNLDNKARLSAVNAEIAEKQRGGAITSSTDAVTKGIDRQIDAQDRLAERTQRQDEADEKIFQRTMRRLGLEYDAQLDALDLEERQLAMAERDQDLSERLRQAKIGLFEAQAQRGADVAAGRGDDPTGVARAQQDVLEASKAIADETAQRERDAQRQRLEGVRDYIADVARLEAEAENRPALQNTLRKRESVLSGRLDVAAAAEDADAVADITARLEAVKTAIERNAGAIRSGNRQTEIASVKTGLETQREAVSSMVASTTEDLGGLYAEQNQLVLDLIEAGVGGTKAVTDAIAAMKERLGTASTEESTAILATIALLEKLDSQANRTFPGKLKDDLVDVTGNIGANGVGTVGSTLSGSMAGAGQPTIIRVEVGGNKLLDYIDEGLYYRRR